MYVFLINFNYVPKTYLKKVCVSLYFSSNSWMSVTKLTASGGASSHEDEQGQPCLRSNAIALDKVFAPAERSRGTYST